MDKDKARRQKVKQVFSELKKEGSPGLPEEKKKPLPKLEDRGSHIEKNALENLFPGIDLQDLVETEEDRKKKKLKLTQLMSQKLARRR